MAALDKVEDGTIFLSSIDLIDGTPILDIKPYIPASDSLPSCRVPGWVAGGGDPVVPPLKRVTFSQEANAQLRTLVPRLRFYNTVESVQAAIEDVLLLDIRTTHMRQRHSEKIYGMCFDTLNIVFEISAVPDGEEAQVIRIETVSKDSTSCTHQAT